jgi:hypothetical protein
VLTLHFRSLYNYDKVIQAKHAKQNPSRSIALAGLALSGFQSEDQMAVHSIGTRHDFEPGY